MKLEAEVTTNFGLFEKGDKVWFQPSTGYYIPGEIIEVNFQNKTTTVQSVIDQKETFIVSNISYLTKRKASSVQNVEDLVQLDELSDPAILWALKCRYDRNRIYTYMGNILISINPYQMHDIYNVDYVKKYRHQAIGSLPAHIFAYADSIYNDMLVDKADHYVVL
uniref:Myosin motor domain-containing protein n=1 Tax=Romanomermis culicivorax TaxID=13658 RepID=A0A915L4I7_ROMCU